MYFVYHSYRFIIYLATNEADNNFSPGTGLMPKHTAIKKKRVKLTEATQQCGTCRNRKILLKAKLLRAEQSGVNPLLPASNSKFQNLQAQLNN
jgi:hypothetical protein